MYTTKNTINASTREEPAGLPAASLLPISYVTLRQVKCHAR